MFNKFPYTDFHELNLDWFLAKFNELLDEWTAMKKEFKTLDDAFQDLKSYVMNYFDNLDLTQEVSDKLDAMVDDGSLEQILMKIYGDTLGVTIVDNVSDMVDHEKVYVLGSDPNGYLWFWDGSAWVQSAISYLNPVNALSFIETDTLMDANDLYRAAIRITTPRIGLVSNLPPGLTSGVILIDYGVLSSARVQVAFNYSYITDNNFWIRTTNDGTNWSDWTDNNINNYLEIIGDITSGDLNDFERCIGKVTTNNIINVAHTPGTSAGFIFTDITVDINARLQTAYNFASNRMPEVWIRKYSSGSWSSWIEITGNYWSIISSGDLDTYDYPGYVYWTTSNGVNIANNPFPMIAGVCKTEYNNHRPGCCVQTVYSWAIRFPGVLAKRVRQQTGAPWSAWEIIRANPIAPGFAFTVIGDSLAVGVTTDASSNLKGFVRQSWGHFLAAKYGCDYFICGKSGASTVDWLNPANSWGLSKLTRLPATPLYFIGLGINDYNQTVPQATFETNYKAIIDAIKSKSPNSVVVCFLIGRTGGWADFNQYIQNVVNTYPASAKILILDMISEINSHPIDYHLYNGHYSVAGYKLIADEIEKKMDDLANQNPSFFRYEFSVIAEPETDQSNGYPFVL